MTPFPIHNERSPEQWEIIKHLDFSGTTVDLGCGYADILFRIAREKEHGELIGIDDNPSIIFRNMRVNDEYDLGVKFTATSIDDFITGRDHETFATAICFSVLPYLYSSDYLLAYLRHKASKTLIECQYAGDGPGFPNIKDDYDMGVWLSKFWSKVSTLGHTKVDYRNLERTIWLCEQ